MNITLKNFFFKKYKLKKINQFINNNLIVFIILIFSIFAFFQKFNLVTNVYYIINKSFYSRLSDSYSRLFFSGFCKKQSHGYLIHIKTKFKHTYTPKVINFDEIRKVPYWIFYETNAKFSNKKIIVLNYNKTKDNLKKKIDMSKYKVLDNFQNRCFFLEKND